jgi:hypothetical protein
MIRLRPNTDIAWVAYKAPTTSWRWQPFAETCWGRIWNALIKNLLFPWAFVGHFTTILQDARSSYQDMTDCVSFLIRRSFTTSIVCEHLTSGVNQFEKNDCDFKPTADSTTEHQTKQTCPKPYLIICTQYTRLTHSVHTLRAAVPPLLCGLTSQSGVPQNNIRTAAFERLSRQQCLFLEHQTVSVVFRGI